jgi:hypothetical protein
VVEAGKLQDSVNGSLTASSSFANGTRNPNLEALEAIINAFRENGLETTLEDLVKVKR